MAPKEGVREGGTLTFLVFLSQLIIIDWKAAEGSTLHTKTDKKKFSVTFCKRRKHI